MPAKDLKGLVDEAKKSLGSGVAVFVGVSEGKAAVVVGVTDDLTKRFSAVDLVHEGGAAVGGTRAAAAGRTWRRAAGPTARRRPRRLQR